MRTAKHYIFVANGSANYGVLAILFNSHSPDRTFPLDGDLKWAWRVSLFHVICLKKKGEEIWKVFENANQEGIISRKQIIKKQNRRTENQNSKLHNPFTLYVLPGRRPSNKEIIQNSHNLKLKKKNKTGVSTGGCSTQTPRPPSSRHLVSWIQCQPYATAIRSTIYKHPTRRHWTHRECVCLWNRLGCGPRWHTNWWRDLSRFCFSTRAR